MAEQSGKELEEIIKKIQVGIEDSLRFRSKLEKDRSDLTHYLKMADQNIKYITQKSKISAVEEYKKVLKASAQAKKSIEALNDQIHQIEKAIDNQKKNLEVFLSKVGEFKNKVLPFKRKSDV